MLRQCFNIIFITPSDRFSLNQNKKEQTERADKENSSYSTPLVINCPSSWQGGPVGQSGNWLLKFCLLLNFMLEYLKSMADESKTINSWTLLPNAKATGMLQCNGQVWRRYWNWIFMIKSWYLDAALFELKVSPTISNKTACSLILIKETKRAWLISYQSLIMYNVLVM